MRIALYKGTSLISKAIRWQTRMDYSHAAFLLRDDSVIEAWQPDVRHVANLSVAHNDKTVVDIFGFVNPFTDFEYDNLCNILTQDLGTPYDYRSIFRFLTRKQADGDDRKLFCSEQVVLRCAQIGRVLLNVEAWRAAPGHIAWSPLLVKLETVVTNRNY